MPNTGKIFETNFKQSAPDYALVYRLPDAAQSFSNSTNLRFSRKNPFDYILWDSKAHILYALELKSVKGKSITFERDEIEKGEIHFHQIAGLLEWSKYAGIKAGFVIEFRQIETTIFLEISDFCKVRDMVSKKSFTIKDLEENNIPYCIIPQKLKKVNYSYDIDNFLTSMNDNGGTYE